MKHVGDITNLSGHTLPPVDCITGVSPCQDLSVAGLRKGLEGERSGLFMEQIRIVKEMREHDRGNGRTDDICRPRYMVWENVPGAFSSNKGEDFRTVLEETAKVAERDARIPRLEKWPHAGCIMGDGWSLAWRLHDAQFWGVPQRRKRIALVADFGGLSAPEILFERKGVSGDIETGGKTQEKTSSCSCEGDCKSHKPVTMNPRPISMICQYDIAGTLGADDYKEPQIVIFDPRSQDGVHRIYDNVFPTLNTSQGEQRQPCVYVDVPRRLTPLEYERLQGFPDGWTDIGEWTDTKGKRHQTADSARYKALGNSIALPFWFYLLHRISAQYERPATLGSLFDGIGGFPYCWEKCNGKGSAIWASEIEEFPIAVTKLRFPKREENE